jgi:hypothetical protein
VRWKKTFGKKEEESDIEYKISKPNQLHRTNSGNVIAVCRINTETFDVFQEELSDGCEE